MKSRLFAVLFSPLIIGAVAAHMIINYPLWGVLAVLISAVVIILLPINMKLFSGTIKSKLQLYAINVILLFGIYCFSYESYYIARSYEAHNIARDYEKKLATVNVGESVVKARRVLAKYIENDRYDQLYIASLPKKPKQYLFGKYAIIFYNESNIITKISTYFPDS